MAHNNRQHSPSRRRLLQGMGILSLGAMCNTLFPARAIAADSLVDTHFLEISGFLVSRAVSPLLGQRYYAALTDHDKQFNQQLNALNAFLQQHKFAHVDDFLAATPQESSEWQTARKIISAWYSGVVGEGSALTLIAYADAMMYLPTRDILVVPTYGGGPFYWAVTADGKVAQAGERA